MTPSLENDMAQPRLSGAARLGDVPPNPPNPRKTPHAHKMQHPRFGLLWKSSETKLGALIWKQCLRSEFPSILLLHWHLDSQCVRKAPSVVYTGGHSRVHGTLTLYTQLAKKVEWRERTTLSSVEGARISVSSMLAASFFSERRSKWW